MFRQPQVRFADAVSRAFGELGSHGLIIDPMVNPPTVANNMGNWNHRLSRERNGFRPSCPCYAPSTTDAFMLQTVARCKRLCYGVKPEVRPNCAADGANQFPGETGSFHQTGAAVTIGAFVGRVTKELIDQAAVCRVNCNGIKSQHLRLRRGLGERADHCGNGLFRDCRATIFPGGHQAQRPFQGCGGQPTRILGRHHPRALFTWRCLFPRPV